MHVRACVTQLTRANHRPTVGIEPHPPRVHLPSTLLPAAVSRRITGLVNYRTGVYGLRVTAEPAARPPPSHSFPIFVLPNLITFLE